MDSQKSKNNIKFLSRKSLIFPSLLKEIPNPPSGIYLLGELPEEKIFKVAIVGTRKATTAGKLLAKKVARILSEKGIVVVSGLAMGIDTAAHEGAVEAQARTIAVLGNGLDLIYPRQNENLAEKILDFKGAIISEYEPKTPALPHHFLERNRIVSGLSEATVVIEAPIRSGSLAIARLAAEQGREVFVFPGPVDHPNYKGSHKLIRDGARLVSSVEDIFEDLGIEIDSALNFNPENKISGPEEKIILEILERAGSSLNIDKIAELAKLEPQVVNRSVALLVINNIIKETGSGYSI